MREKKKNNDLIQHRTSTDVIKENFEKKEKLFVYLKDDDLLRQAVEHEYTTLYRHVHKDAQKTAR
jgi:hypothetical protein